MFEAEQQGTGRTAPERKEEDKKRITPTADWESSTRTAMEVAEARNEPQGLPTAKVHNEAVR
eukprot:294237-Rhodomonas_salina.1